MQNTRGLSTDELRQQLDDIEQQRKRIKDMARRGMVEMDEAERDMAPLNRQMEQLRFQLAEVTKTAELVKEVKDY